MDAAAPSAEPAVAPVIRPVFLPPEAAGGPDSGTFVLRDGARAGLSRALPEDAGRVAAFFARLGESERREVAESLRLDGADVAAFVEDLDAGDGEAFLVAGPRGDGRLVAFGGYRLTDDGDAAVTLAVEEAARQRGIATLLLERLAVLAARRGVARLVGVAGAGNASLLELFRRGGFAAAEERRDDWVRLTLDLAAGTSAAVGDGLAARAFTASSLVPLFRPRSVAVVGASRNRASVGFRILDALVRAGFEGPVHPVNPRARHVGSIRAWPSLAAIGEPVDLAVVAVPAPLVPGVVDEALAAGVRGLVVVTAGFAEVGDEGAEVQRRLVAAVRARGVRMVGPNCLGILHTDPAVRLNASFAPEMPDAGPVALCSQSGALGVAIIALARRLGLGLSSFVSVGNKADVSGNDLLEHWEEDPATRVVLFYLESFGNPRRFARIARRVGRAKPIVVVKAGRSAAGSRAAGSHTAALSAADTAVDALFAQTGILRAETLEEMFGIARALVDQPLPPGRRVAVVTNAGGPAILAVDALAAAGLVVEPLSAETQAAARRVLPREASTGNPVDMIASAGPDAYRHVVETVLAAPEVDALAVVYTPTGMHEVGAVRRAIGDAVAAARRGGGRGKPVFASLFGDDVLVHTLPAGDERVPIYPFPEEIGRVLGKVAGHADWRRADRGVFPELPDQDLGAARALCRDAVERRGEGWLDAAAARRLVALAGVRLAPGGVAADATEAVAIARRVGFPVAVAVASETIVHKSDRGLVRLDLADADAVAGAFAAIAAAVAAAGEEASFQGVLVQPMVSGGAEVMIGVDQDPVFGPLVAFGLGGIHVEVLRDVVFRVSPLTDRDAHDMVRGIRGVRLLEGYRGHPAADLPALEDALLRVSRLAEAVPELAELDLNPVFALPPGEGYLAVDVRVRVRPA